MSNIMHLYCNCLQNITCFYFACESLDENSGQVLSANNAKRNEKSMRRERNNKKNYIYLLPMHV